MNDEKSIINEDSLSEKLRLKMLEAVKICKNDYNYNPTIFLRMLNEHGIVQTAKKLIHGQSLPAGFERLAEEGRVDLTIEYIIINGAWKVLFDEKDIKAAEERVLWAESLRKGKAN